VAELPFGPCSSAAGFGTIDRQAIRERLRFVHVEQAADRSGSGTVSVGGQIDAR
jgi:hypothetical protein